MRNDDKIMGTIHVFVFCLIIAVIWMWIMQQREPEVRHAMEASYGEEPKPEGHGIWNQE